MTMQTIEINGYKINVHACSKCPIDWIGDMKDLTVDGVCMVCGEPVDFEDKEASHAED